MGALRITLAGLLLAAIAAPAAADSLWKQSTDPDFCWFADTKARSVGDVVTVLIKEETKAKTDQTRSETKTTSGLAQIVRFFGNTACSLLGIQKYDATSKNPTTPDPQAQWKSDRKFDAKALAESKENLELRISATVKEVLPNGNLLIEGHREIVQDGDLRRIHVSGIIRPMDVTSDSTVLSERIADARILYQGAGSAMDTKNKGWGERLVDKIWPF